MLSRIRRYRKFDLGFFLNLLSLVFLLTYFAFFVYRSVVGVLYPFELGDYHEPYLFQLSKLVSQGDGLYRDAASEPYIRCFHGPLYVWLVGKMFSVFGASFLIGRLLAFISALTIGFVIFLILKRETNSSLISGIASLFFFSSFTVYMWTPLFRADFFATALSIIAIYVAYRWWNSRAVYVSALLMVLAVFARQTEIAAAVALVLYLYGRDRTLSIKIGGLILLLLLGISLVLNYFTDGVFLLDTVTIPLIHHRDYLNVAKNGYKFLISHPILLVFVMLYPVFRPSQREWLLFGIWAVPVVLISFSGLSLVETGPNHFIEMVAVFCILFGLSLNMTKRSFSKINRNAVSILLSSAVLIQTLLFFHAPRLPNAIQQKYFFSLYPNLHSSLDVAERASIVDLISKTEGKVLSLDGRFTVDAKKKIDIGPDGTYKYLRAAGLWDPTPFWQRIRNKEYALIVSDFAVFNDTLMYDDVIRENYELVYSTPVHSYWVFKPKP